MKGGGSAFPVIVHTEKLTSKINGMWNKNNNDTILANSIKDILAMMQELEYEIMRLKGIDVDALLAEREKQG